MPASTQVPTSAFPDSFQVGGDATLGSSFITFETSMASL